MTYKQRDIVEVNFLFADGQTQTNEQLLDNFIAGRPKVEDLSEEDIMDEVRAVRYAK